MIIISNVFATDKLCCKYQLFDSNSEKFYPVGKDEISIVADEVTSADHKYQFSGNVNLSNGQHNISSNNMTYNHKTKNILIEGKVQYHSKSIKVQGKSLQYNHIKKAATLTESKYLESKNKYNGVAEKIEAISNISLSINNGSISTCPTDQKYPDWSIHASETNIDYITGWAKLKEVKFKLRGTTVAYLPYFDFAVDERRKTGFLYPSAHYDPTNQINLGIPFYLSINNNIDLLSNVHYIQNRGLWASESLRVMTNYSFSKLAFEGIPADRLYNNQSRYLVNFNHKGRVPKLNIRYLVNFSKASDNTFLQDFSSKIHKSDTEYLDRIAQVSYNNSAWKFNAKYHEFQSLIDKKSKYRLAPQVTLKYTPELDKYKLSLEAEANKFEHEDKTKVVGTRFNIDLNLSTKIPNYLGYIYPGLKLRATKYLHLENHLVKKHKQYSGTFYFDSKLFLESNDFSKKWLQTFEPRLFYVYRKNSTQIENINFDSSNINFNYNSLFKHELSNGKDINSELHRISLGIESKSINNKTKSNIFEIKLAQGWNIDKQKLTNFALETTYNYQQWLMKWQFHLDSKKLNSKLARLNLKYQKDSENMTNLSYRYTDENSNYLEISTRMKFNPTLGAFAKIKHSIQKKQVESATIGFSHYSCCWELILYGTMAAKQSSSQNPESIEYSNRLGLAISLKGLSKSNINQKINDILE